MKKISVSILFIFLTCFAANTFACTLGDAQVGNSANGHPNLLICAPDSLMPGNIFKSVQGLQLYDFFDQNSSNADFKRRAEATVGEPYGQILSDLKDEHGVIELYSDDKEGLTYLANKYRKWSGADDVIENTKSEQTPTSVGSVDQLKSLIDQNETTIRALKAGNCNDVKSNASVFKVMFKDGESQNILPVDLEPIPGQTNHFQLQFIRPYMDTSLYYGQKVETREVIIPTSGDIQWISEGTPYPIAKDGFQIYGSFPSAKSDSKNNCDMASVVSKVNYAEGNTVPSGSSAQ